MSNDFVSLILEGPRRHFRGSQGPCFQKIQENRRKYGLDATLSVSGAVLGSSWALLGAVLGCPGRQLGAKLAPKRAPEAEENDFENWSLFGHPLARPFSGFSWILGANMSPCWHQNTTWKRSDVKTAWRLKSMFCYSSSRICCVPDCHFRGKDHKKMHISTAFVLKPYSFRFFLDFDAILGANMGPT